MLKRTTSCSDMIEANTSSSEKIDSVSDLETVFLEGHFDSALVWANRYLEQEQLRMRSQSLSHLDQRNWSLLPSPICLRFDVQQQPRVIYWQYSEGDTADGTSQVAAIALQSWFELYKQEQQQKRNRPFDKGYRFLLPFLETYTSTVPGNVRRCRPMSIELLVLFIRFLSSPIVSQETEAMTLSVEFLKQIRSLSSEKSIIKTTATDGRCFNTVEEESCKELVLHFFTVLIPSHCMSVASVTDLLNVLTSQSKPKEATTEVVINFTKKEIDCPRKEVLQQCLCFCNTDDGNWPHWIQDAFCRCRTTLQTKLREIYHRRCDQNDLDGCHMKIEVPSRNLPLNHNTKSQNLFGNIWNSIGRLLSQQFQPLKTFFNQQNGDSVSLLQKRQIQISCLMVCLAFFCWNRYRSRISKFIQSALLDAVWKPLLEIVQAIKP